MDTKFLTIWLNNPLKTYWKIKYIFKFPKIFCYVGKWYYGFPIYQENAGSILHISSSDVIWKFKYSEVRHEFDPEINIVLFRRWQLYFRFTYKNLDDIVWETILDYLYNKKNIKKAIEDNTWKQYNPVTKTCTTETCIPFLRKKYKEMIND